MRRIFLYGIFLGVVGRLLAQKETSCSNKESCIECSKNLDCWWGNGCFKLSTARYHTDWTDKFLNCSLDNSDLSRLERFCANITRNKIPIMAELANFKGEYGKTDLYCHWKIDNISVKNTLRIKFIKYFDSDSYYKIGYIKKDNTSIQYDMTKVDSFTRTLSSAKEIHFWFLSNQNYKSSPFSFEIEYKSKNYLFFIILALIIFLIVVGSVLSIICWRRSLKRSQKKRRSLGEHPCNLRRFSNIKERTSLIRSIKLNMINELYKPFNYEDRVNAYGTSCTICLENFKKKKKVIEFFCGHIFHSECAQKWVKDNIDNPKCPNCNSEILDVNSNFSQTPVRNCRRSASGQNLVNALSSERRFDDLTAEVISVNRKRSTNSVFISNRLV